MKNRPPIPPTSPNIATPKYTAAEIVRILEAATAQGCKLVELDGFKAAWELPRAGAPAPQPQAPGAPAAPPPRPPAPPAEEPRRENLRLVDEWCTECGSQLEIGKWDKPYCKRCFMDKKDRERRGAGGGFGGGYRRG
jgi:hypothetical protein